MSATTTNLFLLRDLENGSRTGQLADSDREALQAVAGWITTFAVKPHKDLGRAGTVCPFVPGSLELKVLWLAPEQIAGRAGQRLPGSSAGTRDCSWRLHPLGATMLATR